MSFISFAVPLLNGMKMKRTTSMKRILTALALFAVLGSPAWAVYHEETPINSAEIVENGKVLHKHVFE
jgi:hypothetical protein